MAHVRRAQRWELYVKSWPLVIHLFFDFAAHVLYSFGMLFFGLLPCLAALALIAMTAAKNHGLKQDRQANPGMIVIDAQKNRADPNTADLGFRHMLIAMIEALGPSFYIRRGNSQLALQNKQSKTPRHVRNAYSSPPIWTSRQRPPILTA